MRYAIIQGGIVVNVVLAEPEFAAEQGWIAAPDEVSTGWLYDGSTFSPPPPVVKPPEEWHKEIKAERDRRTLEGGYPVAGKWFHSDTVSRTQQLGLVMMGANLPAGIQWKTMDGTFVTMTPALAQLLFQAATVQDTTTFAAAQQAIAQATADPVGFNPATIAWPAIYTPS